MSDTDYGRKRRLGAAAKGLANRVVARAIGYELKQRPMFDFYEGEQYGMDWGAIEAMRPLRVVFQVTCGAHGRHGDDKPDRAVGDYIEQATKAGLKYGLYHLQVPGDPERQADFYMKWVDHFGGLGHMMPINDVEVDTVRGKGWAGEVKTWNDRTEAEYHEPALEYTSKYYWSFLNYWQPEPITGKPVLLPPPWTREHPGWFAGYPFVPWLDANVTMPHTYQANGFKDWAAWQYYPYGRSTPPRGFTKPFPVNDLNQVSEWFELLLEQRIAAQPS